MTKLFSLLFIIQAFTLYPLFCFDCSSVTSFEDCSKLQGCSWDSILQCQGSFSPPCFTTKCYYIDSSSAGAASNGTPQYPLKTLSEGFKKLLNSDGHLIIINYKNNSIIKITETVTLSSNVTITPLFNQHDYIIDLNQVPSAAGSSATSVITVSKQLIVIGATFQNISSSFAKLRIFVLKAGTLQFYVNIKNVNGPTIQAWQIVYDSTASSTKPSNFFYIKGNVIDTSARFLVNGPSTWDSVQFYNFRGNILLSSSMSFPIKFKTCYFIGGAFTFIQAIQTNITIENSTFSGSAVNLFSLEKARQILVLNSTFENIRLASFDFALISIRLKPVQGDYLYSIQDTLFKNITTPYPIISLFGVDSTLSLVRTRMENIKRNETFSQQTKYQQIFGSIPSAICCMATGASLSIIGSNFTSISSDCFGVKASKLSIISSTFNNSALIPKLFLSKDSANLFDGRSGAAWIKMKGISTSIPNGNKIILQENIFASNNLLSLYGGVLSFKGAERAQIIADSNQFIGNSAVYGGVFYLEGITVSLNCKNNRFINNSAFNGGAIYKTTNYKNLILKTNLPSISTKNDIFINNKAIGNGGALFLDWESLKADMTQFLNNKAENGGAINFINLDQPSQNQYGGLSNVLFLGNTASNVGGALKLFFDYSELKENPNYPSVFEKNQDIENNSIHSSKPSYFQFLFYDVIRTDDISLPGDLENTIKWINNHHNTKLARTMNISQEGNLISKIQINQKSGQIMSQILVIQVIDNKNKIANYVDGEKIEIEFTSFENIISDKAPDFYYHANYFLFRKGQIFVYNDFKLEGEPNTKAVLNLKLKSFQNSFLKDANLLMNQNLDINFIDCSIGEIFNKRTRTCDPCRENSYSLGDPYIAKQCLVCLPNAKCLGGAKIAPDPGFWRYNNQTIHVFQTQILEASRGGFDFETGVYSAQAFCTSPYTGAKCDECIQGYASFGSRKGCFNCSNPLYHILSGIFFLLQCGTICYLLKMYLLTKLTQSSETSRRRDVMFSLIKIIVSFIQVVSQLFELKIEFPDIVYNLIWGLTKIIPVGKDGFFTDCYLKLILQNHKFINFARIIGITFVQPFLLWTLLIFVSQTYLHFQKKSPKTHLNMKAINIFSFMAIVYVIHPLILQTFFEIFKCQNYTPDLEESNYLMQENSSIKCYSYDHWIWNILPGSIIVSIWLMLLSYFFLAKQKERNLKTFFDVDFKQNRKYWEIITFLRKLILMLVVNFFFQFSSGLQALIAIFFLYLFFLLQWKFSPYKHSNLNTAELASQSSSLLIMVLLLISSFGQQENEYPKITYFISGVMFLLILSFYLWVIFLMIGGWHIFKKKSSKPSKENTSEKNKRHFQSSVYFTKKDVSQIDSKIGEKQKGENYLKIEQAPIQSKYNGQNIYQLKTNQIQIQYQVMPKTLFLKTLQPILPEPAPFRLISSPDTQRSEDSQLLSPSLSTRNGPSLDLNDFLKTKDQS